MLRVYHGTGSYCLTGLLAGKPVARRRAYVRRPAFCTTTERRVAEMFATRKTGVDDFHAGRVTGVVLEYDLDGTPGRDYDHARDPSCMHDEAEVAVYRVAALRAVAFWRHDGREWVRESLGGG